MPDLITDWRSWSNQQEINSASAFPGVLPFSDVEIISNNTPSPIAITNVTNAGTAVTVTVGTTTYASESGEAEALIVGQVIGVSGVTGFTTNNPNGTWVITATTATTVTFTVTNAPTGAYSSGGTIQPSEIFAVGSLGTVSAPVYDNSPITRNAVDPFNGWTSQQELPASSFGTDFPLTISGVANTVNPSITVNSTFALRVSALDPQYVTISGVVGATGVNGTFPVASIIDATHFTITLGVAPGAYSSGGSVTEAQIERPAVIGLTS